MKKAIFATAIILFAAACGGRADMLSNAYEFLGPQPSGNTVFYLNKPLGNLAWLDTGARAMEHARLDFHTDLMVPLNTPGLVGLVTFEGGMFRVFDAGSRAVVKEISLGTAYDRYQLAPGATHLIATSSLTPEALADFDVIGYLPGQVMAIDLASFAVSVIDMRNIGIHKDLSSGVFVFPPAGAAEEGSIAAILVPQGVIVFDYTDASVVASAQELGFPGSKPRPIAGVFSHDAKTLFVVAEGRTDIFSVGIVREDGSFNTSLNFLPSQAQLGQITTVPEPTLYDSVVAFYPDLGEVVVLDDNATISDELHIKVPSMISFAGTLLDETGRPWVAVTCAGGELKLTDPTNGDVKTASLGGEIGWTQLVPGTGDRYMIVEARAESRESLTVISLGTATADGVKTTRMRLSPYEFTDTVADIFFSGTKAYLIFETARKVVRIDLEMDEFTARDIPAPATRGATVGDELVFVDHRPSRGDTVLRGEWGLMTVVDMAPGSVGEPWSLGGFLLGGLME
jgi:hypothetical protein